MMKYSILVVDDNVLFRKRIVSLIESDSELEVVGEVEDGSLVLKEAMRLNPHLIIMDISMPGLNGLDTTQQLTEKMPFVHIVILSVYDVDEYKKAAFARGAKGYVIKKNMIGDLVPAIKTVINSRC